MVFPKTKIDYKIIPKKLKKENDSLILTYEKYRGSKKDTAPIEKYNVNIDELTDAEKEALKVQSFLIYNPYLALVVEKTECKNLIVKERKWKKYC